MSKTLYLGRDDFDSFERQMKYYVDHIEFSKKTIDLSIFSDELLAYRHCKDENGIWYINCKISGPLQVKLSDSVNKLESVAVASELSEKEEDNDNLANEVKGWRFWNEVNDKEKFEPFLIEFIRFAKKTEPTISSATKVAYNIVYNEFLTDFRQTRTKAGFITRMGKIPPNIHDEITDWLNELMGLTFAAVCKKIKT